MKYCVHWYSHANKPSEIISMDVAKPSTQLENETVFNFSNQEIPVTLNKKDLFIGGKTGAKNLYVTLNQENNTMNRASIRPFETESTLYKLQLAA